ncbi:MAG: BTAD domain-containing putative transcriptional regulator [Aggregatilineales bacterium]
MLRILLLGHPRITFDDEDVELKRRKALALLAYLAVTGKSHSRDSLTAIFFPDQDEKQARSGLRLLLTDLNKTPVSDFLVVDRNIISLREADDLWIDVAQFLGLLQNNPTTAMMHDAVALYDDHFMQGFTISGSAEYDNWQLISTQHLQKKFIGVLEQLVNHQLLTNDVHGAIETLERWLTIDPYYEVAQRQLMRAYSYIGQRAMALHQYGHLQNLLKQELDESPHPLTLELYEAIQGNQTIPLFETETPIYGNLPPVPDLIVGREDALQSMQSRLAALRDATTTTPKIQIVQGWPGIGKTTLTAMLAHDPYVHMLFPDGVLWTSLGEAPDLFSELTVWANALNVDISGVTTIEALSSRVMVALKSQRMLIVVDDVWDVAHVTPFRVGGSQCVMLMTTRLNSVVQSVAVRPQDIYKLPILSDMDSIALLETLAPVAVQEAPDEIRALVHDLEGLPLALQVAGRLLRAEASMGWGVKKLLNELRHDARLLAENAPADRQDSQDEVPLTVEALLRKSTNLLDAESRERFALLGVFAPKPAYFDEDALQAVWAVDEPRKTIRLLVERGLLEPATQGQFQIHALLVMHAKSMFTT